MFSVKFSLQVIPYNFVSTSKLVLLFGKLFCHCFVVLKDKLTVFVIPGG